MIYCNSLLCCHGKPCPKFFPSRLCRSVFYSGENPSLVLLALQTSCLLCCPLYSNIIIMLSSSTSVRLLVLFSPEHAMQFFWEILLKHCFLKIEIILIWHFNCIFIKDVGHIQQSLHCCYFY
jgi:hypothetical protein